jgi:hypothetical protein
MLRRRRLSSFMSSRWGSVVFISVVPDSPDRFFWALKHALSIYNIGGGVAKRSVRDHPSFRLGTLHIRFSVIGHKSVVSWCSARFKKSYKSEMIHPFPLSLALYLSTFLTTSRHRSPASSRKPFTLVFETCIRNPSIRGNTLSPPPYCRRPTFAGKALFTDPI